jgi:hypothetical protein
VAEGEEQLVATENTEDIEAKEVDEDDADPDWKSLPPQPTEAEEDAPDLDLPATRAGPPEPLDPEIIKSRRSTLKELHDLTRETETTQLPSAKQKQELRALRKRIRPLVARPWRMSEEDIDSVAEELEVLITAIEARTREQRGPEEAAVDDVAELEEATGKRPFARGGEKQKREPRINEHLNALARIEGEWEPKDYMAPFAFVPRYLEVNHTVCSAVYLRHPVARMGLAEVPSPFPLETGNLAFSYYLRRR